MRFLREFIHSGQWGGFLWGRVYRGVIASLLGIRERPGGLTAPDPPFLTPSAFPALGQILPWEMPYSSKILWQESILQAPTLELFPFSKNQFPLPDLLPTFQNVLNLSPLEELYYYYIMIHSHSSVVLRNRHVWLTLPVSPSLLKGRICASARKKLRIQSQTDLSSGPSSTIFRLASLERLLNPSIPTLGWRWYLLLGYH